MSADLDLVTAMRDGLTEIADPARAPAMQAYMKSDMPLRGVTSPAAKALFSRVLRAHPLTDSRSWQDTVRELWDRAAYREERYAAVALVADRAYARFRNPAVLGLLDHMVVTGAWWDHVDALATRTIGPLVRAFPAELVPQMLRWSSDQDRWRRRTAIIHQVGAKEATDTALLARCLEPSLASTDFFLRKAIGWALRDLAWRDPEWVQTYVRAHTDRLSGLSRREALKNCGPGQVTDE